MPEIKSHIIVIDGKNGIGKKMFSFELALALLYNNKTTALLLSADSPLHQTMNKRKTTYPFLPQPQIISHEEFYMKANEFDAVIIPTATYNDINSTASTIITLISKNKKSTATFQKNIPYINLIWELKKKIAASYGRSLDWVVCENNIQNKMVDTPTEELNKTAKMYGFRLCPPLNQRQAYTANTTGISAQDKTTAELKKDLTYDDICAKREIIKLAEFIFS